jgi:hypothetical protein
MVATKNPFCVAPDLVVYLLSINGPFDFTGSGGDSIRKWLLANELICQDSGTWELTARGRYWIDMMCATPLPVTTWADPRECGED